MRRRGGAGPSRAQAPREVLKLYAGGTAVRPSLMLDAPSLYGPHKTLYNRYVGWAES